MINFDVYPEGKRFAVTMSYDDGLVNDRRLVELFNRYGIKGTFHLNSGRLDNKNTVSSAEIKDLFKGHEISCHSVTHPTLTNIPTTEVIREVLQDRENLEELCGSLVRGMSYPNGRYSQNVIEILKSCGIVYCRTVESTNGFSLPEDFLKWHPTCHHNDAMKNADTFFNLLNAGGRSGLFYIWGHSYEFNTEEKWEQMEQLCARLARKEQIWYATNIEIYDYKTAQSRLRVSANGKRIENPSSIDVWVISGGNIIKIPSCGVVVL